MFFLSTQSPDALKKRTLQRWLLSYMLFLVFAKPRNKNTRQNNWYWQWNLSFFQALLLGNVESLTWQGIKHPGIFSYFGFLMQNKVTLWKMKLPIFVLSWWKVQGSLWGVSDQNSHFSCRHTVTLRREYSEILFLKTEMISVFSIWALFNPIDLNGPLPSILEEFNSTVFWEFCFFVFFNIICMILLIILLSSCLWTYQVRFCKSRSFISLSFCQSTFFTHRALCVSADSSRSTSLE